MRDRSEQGLAQMFYFLKIKIIILEPFLIHSKTESTDLPYTSCPHIYKPPLLSTSLPRVVTVVATDESTHHHHHPKSIVYSRIHYWCCTFYGLGQICNSAQPQLQYHREYLLIHLPPQTLITYDLFTFSTFAFSIM